MDKKLMDRAYEVTKEGLEGGHSVAAYEEMIKKYGFKDQNFEYCAGIRKAIDEWKNARKKSVAEK